MGHPTDPEELARVEAAFAGSSESEFEICFRRKAGSMVWAVVFISPILDKTGDVVQHFASFVDLSKHKQEEDRLRFLLGELNHRTQNTLATVQAIAVQTLRARRIRKSLTPSRGEFWRCQRPIACWDASIGRR
jgi:two-component sensor histidine kinase